jgi:hypothetical protein
MFKLCEAEYKIHFTKLDKINSLCLFIYLCLSLSLPLSLLLHKLKNFKKDFFYLGLKDGLSPVVKSIAAKIIDAKATSRKMLVSFILILKYNFKTKKLYLLFSEQDSGNFSKSTGVKI